MRSAARSAGRRKIFGIGRNKTGSTSLSKALRELNFMVGTRPHPKLIVEDWQRRDFRRIIRFCHTAQAFQDVPFSLPGTFRALDSRFPRSKFILTVRDSAEQWYESYINSQIKMFGLGKLPDYDDLKHAKYRYPGYILLANRAVYPTPDDDLYNKQILTDHYNAHNESVMEYFRDRPDDLLVINVAEKGSYAKLCKFLKKTPVREEFPWENRTADTKG